MGYLDEFDESDMPEGATALYVISGESALDGPVKLGVTGNPRSRLIQLQTGFHEKLDFDAVCWLTARSYAQEIERWILEWVLADRRLEGEWLDIGPWAIAPALEHLVLLKCGAGPLIGAYYSSGIIESNEKGTEKVWHTSPIDPNKSTTPTQTSSGSRWSRWVHL